MRAAGAKTKGYKLSDSAGPHLHVSAASHKSWRYKYRFEKKKPLLTLGGYPDILFADAREKRDEGKIILRHCRDPRHAATRGRLVSDTGSAKTIEIGGRERHALRLDRAIPVLANDVIDSLERDVFPDIGAMETARCVK